VARRAGARAHIKDRATGFAQRRLEIPPNGGNLEIEYSTKRGHEPAPHGRQVTKRGRWPTLVVPKGLIAAGEGTHRGSSTNSDVFDPEWRLPRSAGAGPPYPASLGGVAKPISEAANVFDDAGCSLRCVVTRQQIAPSESLE